MSTSLQHRWPIWLLSVSSLFAGCASSSGGPEIEFTTKDSATGNVYAFCSDGKTVSSYHCSEEQQAFMGDPKNQNLPIEELKQKANALIEISKNILEGSPLALEGSINHINRDLQRIVEDRSKKALIRNDWGEYVLPAGGF